MKATHGILFFLFLIVFSGCLVSREDLGALIDLKNEQQSQREFLDQEYTNFKKAYEAVSKNQIYQGEGSREIVEKIGEPIEKHPEEDLTRWLYHDSREKWFDRSKVYLYFDADKRFVRWKCVKIECPESPPL